MIRPPQIGRVTDAIILGQSAECLLCVSGWTALRQDICGGTARWCRRPKGAPKRAAFASAVGATYRRDWNLS